MPIRVFLQLVGAKGRSRVFANVHFFNRQAAREKLAAVRALTETARQRHLAMAEDYQKRADAVRSALKLRPTSGCAQPPH